MKKKAVCFDLWWTLVHYKRGSFIIKRIINYTSSKDKKLAKALIEHTMTRDDLRLEDRFSDFAAEYGVKNRGVTRIMLKIWNRVQRKAVPYKYTKITLQELKRQGIKTALITNTIEVKEMLDRMGLTKYFDELIISTDVGLIKPDPLIYQLAIRRLGVNASECIMVGDDITRDIIPANKLGMTSVLIHRSSRKKKFKEPKHVIKRLTDLLRIIDELNN